MIFVIIITSVFVGALITTILADIAFAAHVIFTCIMFAASFMALLLWMVFVDRVDSNIAEPVGLFILGIMSA